METLVRLEGEVDALLRSFESRWAHFSSKTTRHVIGELKQVADMKGNSWGRVQNILVQCGEHWRANNVNKLGRRVDRIRDCVVVLGDEAPGMDQGEVRDVVTRIKGKLRSFVERMDPEADDGAAEVSFEGALSSDEWVRGFRSINRSGGSGRNGARHKRAKRNRGRHTGGRRRP